MAECTREVYALTEGPCGGGWGYAVLLDGQAVVRQETRPDAEGWVKMTRAEATALADAALAHQQACYPADG